MSRPRRLRRIGVDFTPLLPGGQNGGAGLIALAILRELIALAPEVEFTLLTARPSHADLAAYEAANVTRRCVVETPAGVPPASVPVSAAREVGRGILGRLVSPATAAPLKHAAWAVARRPRRARVARRLAADILFCPFTAPDYWLSGTPLVSIVYDLQHLAYPRFFGPEQRVYRQLHVLDACRRATRVVCVSEDARQTILANVRVRPERLQTIPLTVLQDVRPPPVEVREAVLSRFGLAGTQFLLYPANFWPHKNHAALFEAVRLFRERRPESTLRLVCAGVPGPDMDGCVRVARSLLPAETVVFPGRVVGQDLAALFASSRALVFPSLYEGFGMPVLEAMAAGLPVLCADATSLPEVAGDAALLFDPRDPRAIAAQIERLETEPGLVASLVERGRARAATFGTSRDMAARYLELFAGLVGACGSPSLRPA